MQTRKTLSFEIKEARNMLIYTLLGMLIIVSAYFFIKTSSSAEKGYLLNENQSIQKDLGSQNRLLKQQLLEAQSISALKSDETVKSMQNPENIIYVKPPEPKKRR